MPLFTYKARDEAGKQVKGSVEASSEDQAMRQVDRLGFIPIEVREVADSQAGTSKQSRSGSPAYRGRVSLTEVIVMTRQLCTLLQAGVPIMNCMDALVAQNTHPGVRAILQGVQKDVGGGSQLSAAFAKYPKVFSQLYVQTVRAGEVAGVLPEVLMKLADMMESDLETMRAVKSAVRYPIMVVIALTVAFFVLITFVVPRFKALFDRFDTQLPLPTRILIGANALIVNWWYIVIPALAGLIFFLYSLVQTKRGRYVWDGFVLKVPVFGDLVLKVSMMRFSRMFATLYKAGVPVLRVIEIVSQTLGNSVIGKEVADMGQSVKQGTGLSEPLQKSAHFPPMVVHMMSVGEKSGAVDEMLLEVAKHYDLETKYVVRNLTSLIEPMLIVGLGLIVLLLALGIFLPMWNLVKLYH